MGGRACPIFIGFRLRLRPENSLKRTLQWVAESGSARFLKVPRSALAAGTELENHGVDTIAFAARRRPVFKDVAKMSIAARTANFHTQHAVASVLDAADVGPRCLGPEGWPTAVGFILGLGLKKQLPAAHAMIGTRPLLVEQVARAGILSAGLA